MEGKEDDDRKMIREHDEGREEEDTIMERSAAWGRW
jgi:hypothetical protein